MTQLSLFDPPPAAGVTYAVVCRLTGDIVAVYPQRSQAQERCDRANAKFGRIARRDPDVDPRWCIIPEALRGQFRYVVEEIRTSEEGGEA